MKYDFNGLTHGPMHILVGGGWEEAPSLFHQTSTDEMGVTRPVNDNIDYLLQGPLKVVLFKLLWRMGYSRCPSAGSCAGSSSSSTTSTSSSSSPSEPLPASSCRCKVPDLYLHTYGAKEILRATNISSFLSLVPEFNDHADDDTYLLKVLKALEDPGIVGDMLSSAAAYDPIFWPLHGAIERLLGFKRLSVRLGKVKVFDEEWSFPTFKISDNDPYLNGVCDWSAVEGPTDLTLPKCQMGLPCEGHGEFDALRLFEIEKEFGEFTNRGFYEFMRPWNDDLPYLYDSYDFDYCDGQGFGFFE